MHSQVKKNWALGIPTLLRHLVNLLRCQRGSLDGVMFSVCAVLRIPTPNKQLRPQSLLLSQYVHKNRNEYRSILLTTEALDLPQ